MRTEWFGEAAVAVRRVAEARHGPEERIEG
jgi:hypothetical protein